MLETTECIEIKNNGRIYTDCMEFSLLRFLQLMMYDKEQLTDYFKSSYVKKELISEFNLACINKPKISNKSLYIELQKFIERYPNIYPNAKYYLSNPEGIKQREDLCKLVSDRNFFDYYRNDGAELFTSVENILNFFNGFFGMDLNVCSEHHQQSLDIIAEKFSSPTKSILIKKSEPIIEVEQMDVECAMGYLSRPDFDYIKYIDDNTKHDVCFKTTKLYMLIDDYTYCWNLSEVYFSNSTLFDNKFLTGHSVIINL
jgi:hypothetical protein